MNLVLMRETTLSTAIAFLMLSKSTTNKTDGTKQKSASGSFSDTKSFVARIHHDPFVLFSAHGAFFRGLTHNNIPPFIKSTITLNVFILGYCEMSTMSSNRAKYDNDKSHPQPILDIGGDENDRRSNQGVAGSTRMDTGRACPAAEYYAQWCQLVGAGTFYAVACLSGGFGKVVFGFDGLSAGCGAVGDGQCHGLE